MNQGSFAVVKNSVLTSSIHLANCVQTLIELFALLDLSIHSSRYCMNEVADIFHTRNSR